jgi:hypothetical protein
MRGVSIRAVVIALVATLGLDIVAGMVLSATLGGDQLAAATNEQQRRAVMMALAQSPAFLRWAAIEGTLTTVLGGYLAARLAEHVPYMNALAFGIVGTLMALLPAQAAPPQWFSIFALATTVPAALVGGHIAKRQRRGF